MPRSVASWERDRSRLRFARKTVKCNRLFRAHRYSRFGGFSKVPTLQLIPVVPGPASKSSETSFRPWRVITEAVGEGSILSAICGTEDRKGLRGCGCRRLLNGVPVADVKRCRRRRAPYGTFSRLACVNEKVYCFLAMLALPLGEVCAAMLACASLWAAVCDPDGVWPFN